MSKQKIKSFEGNLNDYDNYQSYHKSNVEAEKTLLELRRIQITEKMLSATLEEKEELEKEYFEVVKKLRNIS